MAMTNWVHLEDCHIKRTTDAALLVTCDGSDYWLPRSQVSEGGKNLEEGDGPVTVSCTEWIARQKGIEVE